MKDSNEYLTGLAEHYSRQLDLQEEELKHLPEGYLALRNDLKQPAYVWVRPGMEVDSNGISRPRYDRKTITDREPLIRQLARKEYLKNSNRLLTEELGRINTFLRECREPDADTVLKMLPKAYQNLPEKMFFRERHDATQWAQAKYEQNTYRPEEKIHRTLSGLRVRSKSELMIADKLELYELPFRYEAMIYFEQYSFSPDFMIMTKDGIVYWEHCGMMTNPHYKRNNEWKLRMYEKMGIVPWKNLIITYDTEDGGLDLRIIESEIVNKLITTKI